MTMDKLLGIPKFIKHTLEYVAETTGKQKGKQI
jgi:hypothetical protein